MKRNVLSFGFCFNHLYDAYMKCRQFILLVPFISISNISAQSVRGEIKELSVNAADSSIWLASNAGIVYRTKDLAGDFKIVLQLPEPKPDYFGEKKINIEHISFFNRDTLFISGYIGEDLIGKEMGKPDKIFLSNNGGKDWSMKKFPGSGIWVYDCLAEKNGKAWMGGSDGKVYYSVDYGNTWEKISAPFNGKSRLESIGKRNNNGAVGSLSNGLKLTVDNFHTFKSFATPFDGKAYYFSKEEIEKNYITNRLLAVKLVNDSTIVVNQQGMVFYSGLKTPDWKYIKPELTGFCFDESTGKLVGLSTDKKILLFNAALRTEKTLIEVGADENVIDFKSVNGTLYILAVKYFPERTGDNVVGSVGNMQVIRVGYRKVSHYVLYKINAEGTKKLILECTYE